MRNDIRFSGEVLRALGAAEYLQVQEDLQEYARLGGFTLATRGSPWANSPIISDEEMRQAHTGLDELRRHMLPRTESALEQAGEDTHLPNADTVANWAARVLVWRAAADALSHFAPEIYERDLDADCEHLSAASRGPLARMSASLFSRAYKSCRRELRSLHTGNGKLGSTELYEQTCAARDTARDWQQLGGTDVPRPPDAVPELETSYRALLEALHRLEAWTGRSGLTELPLHDLRSLLDQLSADQTTLVNLPGLHRLRTAMRAAGLDELLAEMHERQATEQFAVQSLRYTWLQSILDQLSLFEVTIGGFVPEKHEKAVHEFKTGDHRHLDATPARIRRLCAENAVRMREQFPEQATLLERQARRKRRHLPVRDLVHHTADVLLALKPCWAMSPLVVSQLLPPKAYFDVVIFDEASQVRPADAVTSIVRGRQVVVAGDDKQLPPTAFFEAGEDDEKPADEDGATPLAAGTRGFESILDALAPILPHPRTLEWHYRSRDERLIAFSNAHLYGRMLTTFPGIGGSEVLKHVPLRWEPGAETNSPTPEVNAVVDLIFEHARERPGESLGVIALGIKHANRIDECRRQRLSQDRRLAEQLGEFFNEEREERFFVKNLERVQGDERDAIILSIGCGKNARDQLDYRSFGPLLNEGGERRLNVAVTRAKNRLTLVSSFSHHDMDPERSNAEGVKLLRQYLQYVESRGTNLGDHVLEKPALNPFELDVRDTLTRHGLKLTAQYSSSGYWIDFTAQHPTQPGRYVLAIECDGITYHSSQSARDRDRLRQEHLERLGWRFCRIWSSEWFYNKNTSVQNVLDAHQDAVRDTDRRADPDLKPNEPPTPAPTLEPQTPQRRPRPPLCRGLPIDDYTPSDLVRLIRWIESDDQLRTEEELIIEAMNDLGFRRQGRKIVTALRTAIHQSRKPSRTAHRQSQRFPLGVILFSRITSLLV